LNMGVKAAPKPKKSTKLTPLPKLKVAVQALANRYARERDCFGDVGTGCISCGKWFPFEELDGGHYIPTTMSSTRFDERNINAQCHRCNRFLHANLRGYFRGLEKKLGRSGLDDLEAIAGPHKWTRDELNALRDYYKAKLKDIRAGIPPTVANGPVDMQSMFSNLSTPDSVS
jgi:hypothetical protein